MNEALFVPSFVFVFSALLYKISFPLNILSVAWNEILLNSKLAKQGHLEVLDHRCISDRVIRILERLGSRPSFTPNSSFLFMHTLGGS